ncbi:MAG: GAF domain-containing protein, partial [Desulfuromonadaceae bacterium]
MIPVEIVSIISLLYIGMLFVVAYFAEKNRKAVRSVTSNFYIYSLSLAVYYTSWSYYGLVGQAATVGIVFIAAYLGPTLMVFSWWFLLRKMVRVSKEQNILSIADFISSRYGKSVFLGNIVTIFSIMAIMPNLALQLKAVAYTFNILAAPLKTTDEFAHILLSLPPFIDTAFIAALILAAFAILFGVRRLDASEHHEGLVAVIALQSVVKLVAFLAVGIFVTYGLFDGITDIFTRFAAQFPDRADLFLLGTPKVPYTLWYSWLFIPMMAVMFLPHQFHIMVIENSDENHIKEAMWFFPVYTLLLSLFVMPIALGGTIISGGDTAAADYFAIRLPLQSGHPWLAMLVFIGGFSASAGMVMLESVVLSTMILNHLVIPLILKFKIEASDMSHILINIKRVGVIAIVLLGHLYYQLIGEPYTLINMGVVSLIAACQFTPSIIGGLFWKRATRQGASAGLIAGFILWFYTLLLPMLVRSSWFYDQLLPLLVRWGWLERDILQDGPFGFAILRPLELFGLTGLDMLSHSLFWTLFFNLGAFLAISILTTPNKIEAEQTAKFVDVFETREEPAQLKRMRKAPTISEFSALMTKFIGEKQAHAAIAQYLEGKQIDKRGSLSEFELPILKLFTERVLAGSVGAASAGIIVESYMAARGSELEDVFDIFGTVSLSRTTSREQLSVLYEAARIVAGKADLQSILDNILKLLQEQFKFETCIIRLLDKDQTCLSVRGHVGMSFKHFDESVRELNMETYAGEAFLTNAVVVVNDTDIMDKSLSARVVRQEGIKSFAHAPIMIEGNAVGILSAF